MVRGPRSGCSPHGCGPSYFHGGGHVAYRARRRYWRDAMDDGLLDNLYLAPPVQKEVVIAPETSTIVVDGKHFVIASLVLIVLVLLMANLRR